MTDGTTKRMIGEALREIVLSARSGGPLVRVGLMASGSELGPEELAMGAILAMRSRPGLEVVMIGPRVDGYDQLSFIETPDCEEDISKAMESALKEGEISAAVALHYPFPLGVTTIGRVVTPARGKPMFIASTTGASASDRIEAMVRNAVYGIAVARSLGVDQGHRSASSTSKGLNWSSGLSAGSGTKVSRSPSAAASERTEVRYFAGTIFCRCRRCLCCRYSYRERSDKDVLRLYNRRWI